MNSPTIAAVAPGLKPQTEHSARAVDQHAAQGDSFANVLAQQAAPQRADAQTDASTITPDDAVSGETAANGALGDEPRAREDLANAKDQDQSDALGSTLPHIALEIALHARHQAQLESSRSEAEISQAVAIGRPDKREAMGSAPQTDAAIGHSSQAKDPAVLKDLPLSTGTSTLALAQAAGTVAGDGAGPSGSKRVGTHQTELKPTVSAATLQDKLALRTSAGAIDKAATHAQSPATALSAATQNLTVVSDPATLEPRSSFIEPSGISSPSTSGFNPFSLPTSASSTPTGSLAITTPVHQPGWSADFGRQVVLLARDSHSGTQTAELRLDPPELGPLRISLSLNDGMASALFVSAHASVRHAVEAALPQLSQQLAEAGIALGEAHVGDQDQAGFAFNKGEERSGLPGSNTAEGKAATQDPVPAPRRAAAAHALVDTFA